MVPMNMNVVEKGNIWETCGPMFAFELHTLQEYTVTNAWIMYFTFLNLISRSSCM